MGTAVELFRSGGGVVIATLVGSLLISRLFKISPLLTLVAAAIPVCLPYTEIPEIKKISATHPGLLFGATWGALVVLASLWTLVRPALTALVDAVGIFKLGYLLTLAMALVVVGLLYIDPEILSSYAPQWRTTAGGVLLGASLVSVSRALAKILRAGIVLIVWSGVSLVLGSEIFLHKMPHVIERRDLIQLQSVVSADATERMFDTLQRIVSFSRGAWATMGLSSNLSVEDASAQAQVLLQRSSLGGRQAMVKPGSQEL